MNLKVLNVAGARPNFVKIAPLMKVMSEREGVTPLLIHTGQHYDRGLAKVFFEDLGIPAPDENLAVGSASHAVQTAEIMRRFEPVLLRETPDVVVVVGDVNSTIACALVAAKLGVPVAHVEAGLRSFDRRMPEEINRVLTDHASDALFVTEESGLRNLEKEGIDSDKVFFVGNVMIDTLLANRERARRSDVLARLDLEPGGYAVVTLHRPSNVDHEDVLAGILDALARIASDLPVVWPVHPRTVARLTEFGMEGRLETTDGLSAVLPLGYLDFLALMSDARVMLTDSGGIQEESCVLGVPCVTLRENTERPSTLEVGANVLAGSDPGAIVAATERQSARFDEQWELPPRWDGKAAERIVDALVARFASDGGRDGR